MTAQLKGKGAKLATLKALLKLIVDGVAQAARQSFMRPASGR